MKIGIFGGSFNPVHTGHLIIAEYVREHCNLDKILFVPVGVPSHRENNLLSYENRVEMLKLAIKDNSNFEISYIEKGISSYTFETYLKLKKEYPNDELFEIIGEDSLAYLDKWKDYEKMIEEVDFIVFKRGNYRAHVENKKIKILKNPKIDISSTLIRNSVENGLSVKYLVSEKVEEYISRKKLYKLEE